MPSPYISFVLWTRNDDYIVNQLFVQQRALAVLVEQLERYKIQSEIIVAEWNPPADRAPLKEVLRFPASSQMVTVKIITVDPEYHRHYEGWEKRPMHGSTAANVGIRRARGRFVLLKVQDSFYSEPLMKFLAEKNLSARSVYRCDRYDFDSSVFDEVHATTESFLEACSRNVAVVRQEPHYGFAGFPGLHMGAVGDFLLMSKEIWHEIRGFQETADTYCRGVDIIALCAASAVGATQIVLPDECRVYKLVYPDRWRPSFWRRWPLMAIRKAIPFSMQQRISYLLNIPKLRTSHGDVLDSFARVFLPTALRWAKGVGPFYLNGENWGLAQDNLPEQTVCKAQWDD